MKENLYFDMISFISLRSITYKTFYYKNEFRNFKKIKGQK